MVNDDGVPAVAAEWALWGRHAADTGHGVLACSRGNLKPGDFARVITRYMVGVPGRLPQYTVAWVPSVSTDPERRTGEAEYIALALHEQVAGGRADASVRLFCLRYADLAEYGVSYTELAGRVQRQRLPPVTGASPVTGATRPIAVRLGGGPSSWVPSLRLRELAENIAALLLTTRPVCVLGADAVPAIDRLAFIDLVTSLLPFGLRARFSASTGASPTAQDLRLRLFFASAERDDGGHTVHVRWDEPRPDDVFDAGHEPASRYLGWLRRTGQEVVYLLADQKAPLRFTAEDVGRMIMDMPLDPSVDETLAELSDGLRRDDAVAVRDTLHRLTRYLTAGPGAADRAAFRQYIIRHGLLRDRPALHPGTRAALYRALLKLAFDMPLSYASFCEIVDTVGEPPRGPLRKELLKLGFASYITAFLVATTDSHSRVQQLKLMLEESRCSPIAPLDEFAREITRLRAEHRMGVYEFAVEYLREHAENPAKELSRRGFLARLVTLVFPDDAFAQQSRLEEILRLAYGGPLDRNQIRVLFDELNTPPTAALEAAVARLASWPNADRYVADQAALARQRNAGLGIEVV